MPKISPIKGHNDSSFQVQSLPQRNIPRFKDQPPQPIVRDINTAVYDSIVPIYEVSYNPEFSKSPLASVQMSKKAKVTTYEPILEVQPEERSHVIKNVNNYEGEEQKWNWKTILYWVGVILGILAFVVGLYFFVDFILGRKSPNVKIETNLQPEQYTGGITPIYVNPIPYEGIRPSNSVNSAPIDYTQPPSYGGTTYPSVLPNTYAPSTTVNPTKPPAVTKPTSIPEKPTANVNLIPQNQPNWGIDPLENSIEPLNAYEKFPS